MLNEKNNEIIEFQKELDQQFLTIYEQRSKGIKESSELIHGLVEKVGDFKIFLPLSSLRSIGSDNKYESLPLMAKWVYGYNQMLGDLYTIINMENLIDFFKENKMSEEIKSIENDHYILYLRDNSVTNIALVSKTLQMQSAQEFKEHVIINNKDNESVIIKGKNYNWDLFDKKNMNKSEWDLLEAVKSLENISFSSNEEREKFLTQQTNDKNKYQKMILSLVEKVYLDEIGCRPIFSINVKEMVQYLLKLNAY